MFLILKILGIFAALLIGAIFIIPKILHAERLWRSRGSIEGIVASSSFGASGLSAVVHLSPIVGDGVLLDSLASLFRSYSSWQL